MTAWESIPSLIRFVIWLWAIAVLVSVAVGVLVSIVSVIALLTAH